MQALRPLTEPQNPAQGKLTAAEFYAFAAAISGFGLYILHRLWWLQTLHPSYAQESLDFTGVIVACSGLLSLGWWARRNESATLATVLAGALLGLIFFVSTLGFALVDPTNVKWLLRGDWAAHFIGWHFYRNAPWSWPPGAFNSFWYPVGTAIVYTDSLPLLALPLKLVSALLPARFQYIGFWLLFNCILQSVFGALLMRCFTHRFTAQVLGAGFFLLAPIFIDRINHDTLTTQWLLLAGLWLYFRDPAESWRPLLIWSLLAATAALTHPYLSAMLLALAAAFYLRERFAQHSLSTSQCLLRLGALVCITLTCWWLSGIFTLRPSSGNVEMGVYNANLLTWFDSAYWSRWLPVLPHAGGGQHEGIGYLGLGVLLLGALALMLASRCGQERLTASAWWPLLLITAVLTLFAFSTRFTLGSHVLLDITPKHLPLLGAFRASGRFIWCSCYLITLFAVVSVARRAGVLATPLLAFAFLLQLLELAPFHVSDAQMRISNFRMPAEPTLHTAFWGSGCDRQAPHHAGAAACLRQASRAVFPVLAARCRSRPDDQYRLSCALRRKTYFRLLRCALAATRSW